MATTSHISTPATVEVEALNDFIRREIAPLERKSIMWAEIKRHGRFSGNHSGMESEWRPRFRTRRLVVGAGSPASRSFPQPVLRKVCKLPWRSYDLGESRTKFQRLAVRGESRWTEKAADILTEMAKDYVRDWAPKAYIDGNATATSKEVHGLESIFSVNGCVTNSCAGNPNDSYANQSTALGVTGSWTPITGNGWPTGTGYHEYSWFSPIVVDVNNTAFNGSVANFWYQWQEALNYARTYLDVLQSVRPDLVVFSPEWYRQAQDSLRGQQQFETSDSNLVKLGFQALRYCGIELTTEYGAPQNAGYLLSFEHMEFRSMQNDLIAVEKGHDMYTGEDLYNLDTYGNFLFESPAFFGKIVAISAEGS